MQIHQIFPFVSVVLQTVTGLKVNVYYNALQERIQIIIKFVCNALKAVSNAFLLTNAQFVHL